MTTETLKRTNQPEFGKRVREQRDELGLSRASLARSVGVAEQSIYRIETGSATNISVRLLKDLASALDVRVAHLDPEVLK